MTKVHIAIYSCKALPIDDLFHELTQYADKVNQRSKKGQLIFHHTRWADFDKFLEAQYCHYKTVRYYRMYDLSESQIYKTIASLCAITIYTAQKEMEILNFKVWKRKDGMLRLTTYVPGYDS